MLFQAVDWGRSGGKELMGIFTTFFLLFFFFFPLLLIYYYYYYIFLFFSLITIEIFLHFLPSWSKIWCLYSVAVLSLSWLHITEHLGEQSLLRREPGTAARADKWKAQVGTKQSRRSDVGTLTLGRDSLPPSPLSEEGREAGSLSKKTLKAFAWP